MLFFLHDLCAPSVLLHSTKLAKTFAKPKRRKTWPDSLNKKERPSLCCLMLTEHIKAYPKTEKLSQYNSAEFLSVVSEVRRKNPNLYSFHNLDHVLFNMLLR